MVYAAFDGGSRVSTGRRACAWCVWSDQGHLIQWQVASLTPTQTNNVMEAQGLLHCLRWLRRHLSHTTVVIYGDSALIVNMALCLNICRTDHLRPWIAGIRAHGTGRPVVRLVHVPRDHNGAADALCNWAMDAPPGGHFAVHRGRSWHVVSRPDASSRLDAPPHDLGMRF